ncbi:MAG: long-chain fatty acid--CoA ligase [Actinomycetota bacterium]|nr:long-chain fatty acid--CoA ligase [Actinomycetota bacterium]
MSLLSHLQRNAAEAADQPALLIGETILTHSGLCSAAGQLATVLGDHGIGPDDRIGLMMPNVPAFPVIFYGALQAGCVVVPMNPLLKGREVEYYLKDSGAKALFVWSDVADEARKGAAAVDVEVIAIEDPMAAGLRADVNARADTAERHDDDDAVILYTSGTTGEPKGAQLTHANLTINAETVAGQLLAADTNDVVMGCLPLFHVFGLTCGLNASIVGRSCLALLPRFDPDQALELISAAQVTIFEGVPTMYNAILHAKSADTADTSSLRTCISGGSAMPVEVLKQFEEAFGCTILEGYGLSETSPVASFNLPDRQRKPGSIGVPIDGVEMRVVDDDGNDVERGTPGEIAIRGHNVMKGYWGKPDKTAEAIPDGWFRTGDVATIDEDGYYFIVDRKKDLIIRGGYNVYPREVEEVLYTHPDITEAAVIGIADERMGEEVGAAVVLKEGSSATTDDLKAHAKANLAAYKYPRQVWLVDELPKGPTGKILRREVQAPDADG